MWWPTDPDPGGSAGFRGPDEQTNQNQELTELKDQFAQQQTLIAQLKEMLRKTDQPSLASLEKVEEYASTLQKMQIRAKRNKQKKSALETDDNCTDATVKKSGESRIDTPGKEKVNLLRKQLEENRLKMEQRGKNQKGIEEMVSQLKAQIDESQALVSQSVLTLHNVESKQVTAKNFTTDMSSEELFATVLEKDKRIEELISKVQILEANVIDLQENVKEKDSVIEARTKAITLMSEDLSKKGKSTLDMLDETKEEMRLMQQNFITLETDMKNEKEALLEQLAERNSDIIHLKEENSALQEEKHKLASLVNKLSKENESYNVEIHEKEITIMKLTEMNRELEIKLLSDLSSSKSPEGSKTIDSELEKLSDEETIVPTSEISKTKDPSSETESIKQKELVESKEKDSDSKTEIKSVDKSTLIQRITELENTIEKFKTNEKNPKIKKDDVSKKLSAEKEVTKLSKQLDDMNKSMIKLKAQNKGKIKELQKQLDTFKNVSDLNAELIRIQAENTKLSQKIAELEEEKGNLQLHIVECDNKGDSNMQEKIAELEVRLSEQNAELENYRHSIQISESVKTALENELQDTQQQLAQLKSRVADLTHLENAQVCSEMTSVQLEEKLDQLHDQLGKLKNENSTLNEKIENLISEKIELNSKMENLIHENIELVDRLEKLSAEKVSSAESIEMVESLTQQEKLEMEEYNKSSLFTTSENDNASSDMQDFTHNSELNESVTKLTEESAELMEKIELFTRERKEVMEKMDALTAENSNLIARLEQTEYQKSQLEETYETLFDDKSKLENNLDNITRERNNLLKQVADLLGETTQVNVDSLSNVKMEKEKDSELENTQKEIDMYKSLIEEQKVQIVNLQEELANNDDLKARFEEVALSAKNLEIEKANIENILQQLQNENKTVNNRNKNLEDELILLQTNNENLTHELNQALIINKQSKLVEEELKNSKQHFDDAIAEKDKQITLLQSTIDNTKQELISSAGTINSLRDTVNNNEYEIQQLMNEIGHLNEIIIELNNGIIHLETENKSDGKITQLSNQISEMQLLLSENVEQLKFYENEISKNSVTNQKLNSQLDDLNVQIEEIECLLLQKDEEIINLKQERKNNNLEITNLKSACNEKDRELNKRIADFQEKYKSLQSKITSNEGSLEEIRKPLECKVKELENKCTNLESKNVEQLDKMKKIAANLKKKVALCTELETENKELKAENEQKSKELINFEEKLNCNEEKMKSLLEQTMELENELSLTRDSLQNKSQDYEKLKQDCTNQQTQIQGLTQELKIFTCKMGNVDVESILAQNNDLQNKLTSYVEELEHHKTFKGNLELQITELNQFIASQNDQIQFVKMDNDQKNTSISLLNEEIAHLKSSFEISKSALQAKLQEQDAVIEMLEQENSKYIEKNKKIEESLLLAEESKLNLEQSLEVFKTDLQNKSLVLEEANEVQNNLKEQLILLENSLASTQHQINDINIDNTELSNKNRILTENIKKLEEELSILKQKDVEDANEKIIELEELNTKLSSDILHLENELKKVRDDLHYQTERNKITVDNLESELSAHLEELNSERQRILKRCENCEDINEQLLQKEQLYQNEITTLKQKLSYYEMNQDTEKLNTEQADYMYEISQLKQIIAEKNTEIADYQRRNMQLQMATSSNENFEFCSLENKNNDTEQLRLALDEYQVKYNDLLTKYHENETNWSVASEKCVTDLKNKISEKDMEIQNLIMKIHELQNIKVDQDPEEHSTRIVELEEQNKYLSDELSKYQLNFEPVTSKTVTSELNHPFSNQADIIDQDLESKNKALEFLMCNLEKDKEDTLLQCQELSNELLRLIHERENILKKYNIKKEFENVKEMPIEKDTLNELESQIVSEETANESIQEQKDHLYTEVQSYNPSTGPVIEEPINKQAAYICFNDSEDLVSEENLWGSDEAKLEQAHMQKNMSTMLMSSDNSKIEQLEERVHDLEVERERLLEEIKIMQVRSGKLLKKLKEFKVKNDQLTSELASKNSSSSFIDLDAAIQDELNIQIKYLEKKIADLQSESEKDHAEKDNLLKRIDVLTSANERMIELKEKQDIEMQVLQATNRELNNKLEHLEWGDDSFRCEKTPEHNSQTAAENSDHQIKHLEQQIVDLNAKVNDLSIDNEELQCLLDEQTQLKKDYENKLYNMKGADLDIEQLRQDYDSAITEKNNISEQLNTLLIEKQNLEMEMKEMLKNHNEKQQEYENRLQNNIVTNEEIKHIQENYADIVSNSEEKYNTLLKEKNELMLKITIQNEQCQQLQQERDEILAKLNFQNQSVIEERDQFSEINNRELQYQQLLKEKSQLLENINVQENAYQLLSQDKFDIENKLQEVLIEKSALVESNQNIMQNLKEQLTLLTNSLDNKSKEIEALNSQINTERLQYEESLNLTAEKWSEEVDKRGAQVAESWKLHLESRENEFATIKNNLQAEIKNLDSKFKTLLTSKTNDERDTLSQEVLILKEKLSLLQNEKESFATSSESKFADNQRLSSDLQQALDKIQNLEMELAKCTSLLQSKNMESYQLGLENVRITDKITNYEIELKNSEFLLHTKDTQIASLSQEITDMKNVFERYENDIKHLNNLLNSKDSEIREQLETTKLTMTESENKNKVIADLSEEIKSLHESSESSKSFIENLETELNDLRQRTVEYSEQINQLTDEKIVRDKDIVNLQLQLETKCNECLTLQDAAQRLNAEYSEKIDNIGNIIQLKDKDIENYSLQLEIKINECEELKTKISELYVRIEEDSKQLSDLKDLIEKQVLKIEELKDELNIEKNEVENLRKQLENKPQPNIKNVHFDETLTNVETHEMALNPKTESSSDDPNDLVSRAELDIALYMLHQRDVRCEELTVELMQLLEERDTLQLKLSNAIRINEEIKNKLNSKTEQGSTENTQANRSDVIDLTETPKSTRKSKSSEILLGATGTELAKEATEEVHSSSSADVQTLENKLSQLHSVDYRRDVRLRDDQELRHLQQMSILQQHRDMASLLPPEAAARLVDANYTLSRDVQSPSTVLLNWLWGRSTPKVNDI